MPYCKNPKRPVAHWPVDVDPALSKVVVFQPPKVGDPATFHVGSDSYACTVVNVSSSGKTVTLARDKVHVKGDSTLYSYDPEGRHIVVSARTLSNGTIVWKQVNHRTRSPGCYAVFGRRHAHLDPSF